MSAIGHAKIYLVNRTTGHRKLINHIKNLEVYQSGDAIAKMTDPNLNYAIRYVFFEFANFEEFDTPVPDVSDDISIYAALGANYDYLRVPIIAAPAYDVKDEDDAHFESNRVTFFATTKAAPVVGGDVVGETNGEVLTNGTSIIHSAGLVASTGDPDDDLLFARLNITPSAVTKQDGYDVDIHWAVRFGPLVS